LMVVVWVVVETNAIEESHMTISLSQSTIIFILISFSFSFSLSLLYI
jgi:hypothetical protein